MDADTKVSTESVDPGEARDPLILAIDVGTSSARALVYDGSGRRVKGWEAHRPYAVTTTSDGGVVIDPKQLFELTSECLDAVTEAIGPDRAVAAVACDTFWHSLLGIDAHGQPLTPVYTWADTRSRNAVKQLRARLDEKAVHGRTGCVLHSSYLPAKFQWLQETQPDLVRRVSHWMSFGEYLYLRLFGTRRASLSMASATGLFNQHSLTWDREMLDALSLQESQLSPLSDFDAVMSDLQPPFDKRWPGLRSVPWYLPVGDGGANNIGSGGFCADWVVVMIGTSGAIRVVRDSGQPVTPQGLWTYRVDRRRFVQGGALSDGGNVFAWLTHTLQLPSLAEIETELTTMRPDAHGLTVLPFLAGERSPDWNPDAQAAYVGMTLATKPIDLMRASIEAVALRFGLVYAILRREIPPPRGIIGSGAGLIHSPAWLQIMSDVLGEPMTVSAVPEASSRGAALLVLESMGAIDGLDTIPAPVGEQYSPNPEHAAAYARAAERQQRLYEALLIESTEPSAIRAK